MRPPKEPPKESIFNMLAEESDGKQLWSLINETSATLPDGKYLHWNQLRHRTPPEGVTLEQWWAAIRYHRTNRRVRAAAMSMAFNESFSYVELPQVQESLHRFDRTNVGRILLTALGNEEALDEYRVRQLVEESISSSLLEGAKPTTREQARAMVREQRKPTSHDERMILNNWFAMRRILELHGQGNDLTVNDFLELHRILGEDALDVSGAEGKFRRDADRVQVVDRDGTVWHTPPPAAGIEGRVQALLNFANGSNTKTFIHPVSRAIICHFWLGYEHPFRDGNGRMARALYYWCMLKHGYEMAEFLSISGPIDRSPTAYYMAYAYTESDSGDLTYFILHQLKVMQEALDELVSHLKRRGKRLKALQEVVADFDELNHRQRAVLQRALRYPATSYTIEGHASSHHVHYHTARSDLADLVKRGFFDEKRVGKGKRFFVSRSFAAQARKAGRTAG